MGNGDQRSPALAINQHDMAPIAPYSKKQRAAVSQAGLPLMIKQSIFGGRLLERFCNSMMLEKCGTAAALTPDAWFDGTRILAGTGLAAASSDQASVRTCASRAH